MASASNQPTQGGILPQEIGKVQASIMGAEQAPSSRQQLGSFANWKQVQDQLGQPFNNERVPLSKLKLMRRDPMIGFGSHFTKMPMVRAPYFMHCPDAQVAGFMDSVIRPIFPSLVVQCLMKLDFGFQAIAKRFQPELLTSTYIDKDSGSEAPVWPGGNVPAITLKPFVPLPPEGVDVIWDEATGEFNGILYKPPRGSAPAGAKAKSSGKGGSEGMVEIDLYHSLWVTNEKESVFGNIFGYPRIAYAYPYWWSYWLRWAVADRAFERKGDPQTLVRYPEGDIDLGNGESMSAAEYALIMADRMKAGAGVALPSRTYMGLDDKPSNVREWDIEFLEDKSTINQDDKMFSYLDVQKLRSIFVPEQALIEGSGGTSSRNVAEEMFKGLVEAQSILMGEIVEVVNRFIIPQLMVVNWPEKFTQGIKCEMRTRGFAAQDMELLTQITQLIGQANAAELGIDIREALRQLDMPMLPQAEYEKRLAEAALAASAAGPGAVAPGRDSAGVVPTPGRKPATSANSPGSLTGFADQPGQDFIYVPSLEVITLSDDGAEFLSSLPNSMHYQDKQIRGYARQLRALSRELYRDEYLGFAKYLDSYEGELHLSDEEKEQVEGWDGLEFAPSDFIRDFARRIVAGHEINIDRFTSTLARARGLVNKIVRRSANLVKQDAGLEVELSDDDSEAWVEQRVSDMLSKTIRSTREELEDFAANFMAEGNLDPKELSKSIQAHFSEFPEWKADRFARTETRDAFNAGRLLEGKVNGLTVAQAVDAQLGETDADCEHRDGQFFTIDQALREDEHPNGTLGWNLIREPVTLSRVDNVPGKTKGSQASYDADAKVIYLSQDLDPASEREFLLALGETLAA